jgi:chromosome partitioning protein
MRFLDSLGIPIIAVLRDSQNYVRAAEDGLGIHEVRPPSRVRTDVEQLERIVTWLDGWEARRRRALQISGIRKQPFSAVTMLRKPQVSSV